MPTPTQSRVVVRFGLFEVDLHNRELRKQGVKVKLQEQPFQILVTLLQCAGDVVTREELHRQLWPTDTFVDFEHGLNVAIKRLRDALGDSAEKPVFIETLARRGYRFVAPVRVQDTAGVEPAAVATRYRPSSRLLWIGIALCSLLSIGVVGWRILRRPQSRGELRGLIPKRLTTNSADNRVNAALLSPDGKYLVFNDQTGTYLRLLATGETQAIPHPADVKAAGLPEGTKWIPKAWYPDSTKLVADLAMPGPNVSTSIWSIAVFGGVPRPLYREDADAQAISADGSLIAFAAGRAFAANHEIWVMGAGGEDPHRVLLTGQDEAVSNIVWSPDGRSMGYAKGRFHGDTFTECTFRARSIDTGREEVLFSDTRLCDGWGRVLWLPGNRIIVALDETWGESGNLWELWLDRNGKPRGKLHKITSAPLSAGSVNNLSATADGKRLAFLTYLEQDDVYIGELERGGERMKTPRRLTFDQSLDGPMDWSPDGKYVYFMSTRNQGRAGVYRQKIDKETAESVVTGPNDDLLPHLSPDAKWIVYVESQPGKGIPETGKIMRILTAGGPPEPVFAIERYIYHDCMRAPANFCVLQEQSSDRKQNILTVFDPQKGRGPELGRFDAENSNWAVSPNGSMLALLTARPQQSRIRLIPLSGKKNPVLRKEGSREIAVNNWDRMSTMNWSADSTALFIGALSPKGSVLLRVDLQGHTSVIWQLRGTFTPPWAIPSRDGRYLALRGPTVDSNAWMLENF